MDNKTINKYLNDNSDEKISIKMFEFITELNENQFSDIQLKEIVDIINNINEVDKEFDESLKKVRIDPKKKRERSRAYKKNKQKLKIKAKKFRKTAKFKKWQKKSKKKAASGKTASGKKKVKFV